MNAVKTVLIETPDGVQRSVRLVAAALKRIAERFGTSDIFKIAAEKGDWAFIEVLYYMIYDDKGQPPAGLELEWLMENASRQFSRQAYAAIIEAYTEGATPKNVTEALLLDQMEEMQRLLTGLLSKPLQHSASVSNGKSSGTESRSVNSMPTQNAGESSKTEESRQKTTEQV